MPRTSSEGSASAPRRRWLKCNFPIFLDFVVATYVYLTLCFLGDWAIDRQYHYFKGLPDPVPDPTARIHRSLFRNSARAKLVEPDGLNAFAHVLSMVHLDRLAALVGAVPDIAITLVFGFLTLRALHIAALSDPGAVPDDYEAPAWVDTPGRQEREITAASSPADGAAGASTVKCVPTPAAMVSRLSMPGTSGPTGLPPAGQRQYIHPHSAASRQRTFTPHYCGECHRDRPLRTHHCRFCNACVVRFDHHCDWIDNCVGQRNHQCFFLFIAYILVCIWHFVFMLGRYFTTKAVALEPSLFVVANLIVTCAYCMIVFPCGILALFFIFNTGYQLLRDETTIEANYPKRYPTRKLGGGTVMARLRSVLGKSVLWWWWPALQPLVVVPGEPLAEMSEGTMKLDDVPFKPSASQQV